MITRYYRPEPLPLSAHQYLVIDRLSAGALSALQRITPGRGCIVMGKRGWRMDSNCWLA